MKKLCQFILLFFCLVLLFVGWSFAAPQINDLSQPSWFEHVDFMQTMIGILFLIVGWFFIRTLKKIDTNQTNLFKKYEDHEKRLSHLEGAHEVRTQIGLSCKVEE